ncbi:MAG: nucleoside triphosphate pyrophosphatase [Alphaproteobacteria bacterium]
MEEKAAAWPLAGPAAAPEKLYLASASLARAELLTRAGVLFTQEPAAVDEDEVKAALRANGIAAGELAEALAERKARVVAERHPGALVVGADQVLECGGVWFDKPTDADEARAQLRALRGRAHRLINSTCVVRDGARAWRHTAVAELVMRPFSDDFLEAYVDAADDAALASLGGYQLEGLGAQLFARVTGDYFTILGLPLVPLLEFLRGCGMART